MKEWHLYLIRCGDNSLYTGITTDVEKRFSQHLNNKGAKYLRGRGPIELVFSHNAGDRSTASRLEYQVKQLKRQEKEMLIDGSIRLTSLLPTITEE